MVSLFIEAIVITALVWGTYWYVINHGGYVSDDIEGLAQWEGKLKRFDYGNLNKWLLLHLLSKSPRRNHIFSILLHNANVLLLYLLLLRLTTPTVAFYSCIIFAIHPVAIQAVGWISGRGYPISLFFCLLSFHVGYLLPPFSNQASLQSLIWGLGILGYVALYYIAVQAQFAALATFAVQIFLGNYFLAVLGLLITAATGAGIIREVINIRVKVFKEQNLAKATVFNLRKLIVAIKTFGYYATLCFFPKRLGLYHTFEYNYTEKTEQENKQFWGSFLLLLSAGALFWFGDFTVKLALLWFASYIFIFLNWITIHQFVSERYSYIPLIGICILMAYALQYFPILFAFVIGLYFMRSLMHMPTYENEVSFYQSNIWNFPNSEVAFSNLAVVYIKCGLEGAATDMWLVALNINKEYDVAHYNLSSIFKKRGQLGQAREALKKAVESPTCHFREQWKKELDELDHEIGYAKEANELYTKLAEAQKDPAKQDEAKKLKEQFDKINNIHKEFEEKRKKDLVLLEQEQKQIIERTVQLDKIKEQLVKPVPPEELVKMRDMNFVIFKENASRFLGKDSANATVGDTIQEKK